MFTAATNFLQGSLALKNSHAQALLAFPRPKIIILTQTISQFFSSKI